MAQVQTPREFKFVGGPSRKRRRNGTLSESRNASSSAAAKQAKRSCQQKMMSTPAPVPVPVPAPAPARAYNHLQPPPPPPPPESMPSLAMPIQSSPPPPPSRRSSSASAAGAGLLGSGDLTGHPLTGHHHHHHHNPLTDHALASYPLAASHGGPVTPPSLDGILDWPAGDDDDAALFENALFPVSGMDPALFAEALGLPAEPQGAAEQPLLLPTGTTMPPPPQPGPPFDSPSMALLSPSASSPPASSSTPFSSPAEPHTPRDGAEAEAAADAAGDNNIGRGSSPGSGSGSGNTPTHVPHPYLPLVFLDADKQPYMAAQNLLMGTALRLYTQPSALYDTMTRIFFQYDQEFCILPLTYDFTANPFRYTLAAMQHSPLLRHCILAVSYKHVDYDTGACTSEAGAYKRRATQMLLDRMPAAESGATARDPTLLDATTVLMTLDCATSALGPWRAHLQRAKRLLQQSTAAVAVSPQRRAQIGMLAWMDVTRALTSRNGCILPESTLLRVFDTAADSRDGPSGTAAAGTATTPDPDTLAALEFYAISGCPRELFECMVRLAAYARELRVVSTMACGRFDLAPVLAMERRIACWQSPAFGDPVAQPQGLLDLVTGSGGPPPPFPLPPSFPRAASASPSSSRRRGSKSQGVKPEGAAAPPRYGFAVAGQDADTSALDYRLDLYHCAEAWRYALLIYIERVFKCPVAAAGERRAAADGDVQPSSPPLSSSSSASPPSSSSPSSSSSSSSAPSSSSSPPDNRAQILHLLARRTLNHVTACRRSTYVQKQLLLPVFLAGAEVRDASLRSDASEFCVWWATKTRYNMFITVRALLEEVWRRQDADDEGGDKGYVWWGDVFDQQSREDEKEYMLG